jgi:7-cyano-7-deazaguanine tRNA-ribosyltransferase
MLELGEPQAYRRAVGTACEPASQEPKPSFMDSCHHCSGDRIVANLGSWRGREPSENEWNTLVVCQWPARRQFGIDGLQATGQATGIRGFSNRATHNLWTLLDEARQIKAHFTASSYRTWYKDHLDNSIYLPLIEQTLSQTIQSGL